MFVLGGIFACIKFYNSGQEGKRKMTPIYYGNKARIFNSITKRNEIMKNASQKYSEFDLWSISSFQKSHVLMILKMP